MKFLFLLNNIHTNIIIIVFNSLNNNSNLAELESYWFYINEIYLYIHTNTDKKLLL